MKQISTFAATIEESRNRLWGSHVRVPGRVARTFLARSSRRVIRTLNGSAKHQCALLPIGQGVYVLAVNKALMKKLGLSIGDRVTVAVRPDTSPYGLPLTPELKELLRQDAEGSRLFHALTSGRRRTLLHIAGSGGDTETRAWRASVIIRHLKHQAGAIRYQLLAEELKRPGRRRRGK